MRISYTARPDVSELEIPTLVVVLVLAGIVAFFVLIIWSMKRHRDPKLEVDCDTPIEELLPSLAGLTLGSVVDGNSVEVLENRAFFDALIEEIDQARSSVHFETFLWKEGKVGTRLSEALIGRARAGVNVRVLLDANGTRGMGKDVEQRLVQAGCKLRKFHRPTLANLGVINERDHRKLAIVDGRVGFVGGHCIVDSWLAEEGAKERVMDVSVRLRGPIVHSMQSAFSENWVGQTGELFMGERVFPPQRANGIAKVLRHGAPEVFPLLVPLHMFAQLFSDLLYGSEVAELPLRLPARVIPIPALRQEVIHLGFEVEAQLVLHVRLRIRTEEARIAAPQWGPWLHFSSASGGCVAPRTLPTASA